MTTSIDSASSSPATSAPITCLFTGMLTSAQPKHRIEVHRGLNLITVSITLTAALLGLTLFNSPLFLQGNTLTQDIHVISGPTLLNNARSMLSPSPPYSMSDTKCHPSGPIPDSDSEPVLPTTKADLKRYQRKFYDSNRAKNIYSDRKNRVYSKRPYRRKARSNMLY